MKDDAAPKTILFSPLGDTDPVRDCYDGACLHILRHYRPDMVVLFYTKEMWEKESADHRYTRVIRHLAPDIEIREIRSGIVAAHLLEEIFPLLPESIREIHAEYPEAKILLNLSSGTPQIKTLASITAVESSWCLGVQVSSPAKGSNRHNHAAQDHDDVDMMIEENLDDDPEAENRCSEPPLRAVAYYGEKNRILSLVDAYEYGAALELAKDIPEMPEPAKKLIEHAKFRQELQPKTARTIMNHIGNMKLLPYSDKQELLLEYFLTMQVDTKKEKYSRLVVKIVPFLFEYLQTYLEKHCPFRLEKICNIYNNDQFCLDRRKMEQTAPGLPAFMDSFYKKPLRDGTDLSARTMHEICKYLAERNLVRDTASHRKLLEDLDNIGDLLKTRNKIAHRIANIDRRKFISWTDIEPEAMLDTFFHMLRLLYGDAISTQRNMYEKINEHIRRLLNESV